MVQPDNGGCLHHEAKKFSTFLSWSLLQIVIVTFSVKLVLIPAPHSTDFEVHRHWKALTVGLPLSQWYTDESSIWTLDYPPAFAFFEWFLGSILRWLHPSLVDLTNHNYSSTSTVFLMRLTVLLIDPFFIFSVCYFVTSLKIPNTHRFLAIAAVLLNPALIIVDNIHFQYNHLPLSLLYLSLSALQYSYFPLAAAIFTLAINSKHTMLPIALPLVVYVLSSMRCSRSTIPRLIFTATVAVSAFLIPWIPFFVNGRWPLLKQISSRLFPFKRGLLHANWAPNFWAFYAVIDKLLTRFGCIVRVPDASITTGHIGSLRPFSCLPNPSPLVCAFLTFAGALPVTVRLSTRRNSIALNRAVIATALATVLFGWHVHEKALLTPLLLLAPLSLLTPNPTFSFAMLILTPATHLVIFDLVTDTAAALFARFFSFTFCILAFAGLSSNLRKQHRNQAVIYNFGCAIVELYCNTGLHSLLLKDKLPFVPKILTSICAFVGVATSYIVLSFSNP